MAQDQIQARIDALLTQLLYCAPSQKASIEQRINALQIQIEYATTE